MEALLHFRIFFVTLRVPLTDCNDLVYLFLAEAFDPNKSIAGFLAGSQQFVELGLYPGPIPVLRVLNEKTMRKVMMVVPVLMTSRQVSE